MSERSDGKLQVRVLQSLQVAIACCDPIPELSHFFRPPMKIATRKLFSDFNAESDAEVYDFVVDGFPWGLRSKKLIGMVWDSLPASCVSFSAIQLDQYTSLYFEFNDDDEDHVHLLAVAQGLSTDRAHEIFLRELFRSNGGTFNTGVWASPPTEVTSKSPKSVLVENFLLGASRAMESGSDDFWGEVLQIIGWDSDIDIVSETGRQKVMEAYIETVVCSG
jgi:hypothetical protein